MDRCTECFNLEPFCTCEPDVVRAATQITYEAATRPDLSKALEAWHRYIHNQQQQMIEQHYRAIFQIDTDNLD